MFVKTNNKMMQIMQLLILLSLPLFASSSSNRTAMGLQGCPTECGGIEIPYPFGIGTNCSRDEGFLVTCNNTFTPPKPFVGTGNLEIIDIKSVDEDHQLTVNLDMANQTFNSSGYMKGWTISAWLGGPYVFSTTENKFFVLGCYTLGYLDGYTDKSVSFTSGCVASCGDGPRSMTNGSCDGIGCCQAPIPKGLTSYDISFDTGFTNYTQHNYKSYSPSNYAFVAQASWFNFTSDDLFPEFGVQNQGRIPAVIDWAIRDNHTCQNATSTPDTYACRSANSLCFDATNGDGYLCNCSTGYRGNPYLVGGCQDINECDPEHQEHYKCYGTCTNLMGGYNCTCPDGTTGNATVQGGCIPIQHQSKFPLAAKLAIGVAVGIIVLISISSSLILAWLNRKHKKERETFFNQNGGLLLFERMKSKRVDTIQIFTKYELEKATDNFDESKVIGFGGRGMVYKGTLENGRVVAIKKSKVFDEDQKEEFVNEIIILSQINHKNVVKLLGCCLEVDVPMLVYEFVSKGSLYGVLHNHKTSLDSHSMNLGMRLQIAAESAEALSYMHSSISRSIVHGDVKSQNILLDEKYIAKVSDFGASQLVPLGEAEFLQFVQGTLGYLDPECLLTHKLTDKSDVYSFGVVLLELLTRKMAIYMDDILGQKRHLTSVFIEVMKENNLRSILDNHIIEECEWDIIQQIAELAKQCLCLNGEERPTMRDVSDKLHSLINQCKSHPWQQHEFDEEQSLISNQEPSPSNTNYTTENITTTTIDFETLQGRPLALNIEEGR